MAFRRVKLIDILECLESGSRPKGGSVSNGIPSIGGEHLDRSGNFKFKNLKYIPVNYYTNMKKGKIEKNDILIVKDGATTGKTAFVDGNFPFAKAAINEHIFRLKIKTDLADAKYIFYYLFSNVGHDEILRDFRGATIGGISRKFAEITKIPLPPFATQQKIAEVLDKAQELIDKRKEQIEKLDMFLQSVFVDIFGDPKKNPRGWEKGKIRDMVSEVRYGTSKKANDKIGQYPILRMGNITYGGYWDFTDLKYIDLDNSELSKYLVYKGDLLFNRTNSKDLVGKTAVYKKNTPMAYAGYLIRVRVNQRATPEYLWGYLNSNYGKLILKNICKNIIGMANINAQELQNVEILSPPLDIQNKFAQIVEETERQKELMQKGLVEMENNFNSIMQKAFRGELFA